MFEPDSDYYHEWRGFTEIKTETAKAYLVVSGTIEFWIAKSLIHGLRKDSMLVHASTFDKIYNIAYDLTKKSSASYECFNKLKRILK